MIAVGRDQLNEALYAAELDEEALYLDYSGRGMYGERCFGIVGAGYQLTMFFAALGSVIGEQAVDIARHTRHDSMGRSEIAYFPGVTIEEES